MVKNIRFEKIEVEKVHLNTLQGGTPGITPAIGETFAEAAAVCLEDQKHSSGVGINVNGDFSEAFAIAWDETTDQMRRSWADLQFATEMGAYGVAVVLLHELTELTVVERSRKGTGFDFWLGIKNEIAKTLFQGKARLEVSGILNGDENTIRSRVRQKLRQTNRSDGSLPALIVIVEFSMPCSKVINKWKR